MNHNQIDNSLGRNNVSDPSNGEMVYLSHCPDGQFMTAQADFYTLAEAIELVERGLVWGLNDVAENALRDVVDAELARAA